MSRTYSELIDLVRRWSNRDTEVLPNNIIADCVRYAADKAYRQLRIAPLEHTLVYRDNLLEATTSTNNRYASVTELAIPADLIEFIQIRGVDSEGRTTRMFNEKADVRTFNDLYAEKYNDFAFWTRQGNCILLSPGFRNTGDQSGSLGIGNEEGFELYYYRRLPALYARYEANMANLGYNLLTRETTAPTGTSDTPDVAPTPLVLDSNTTIGTVTFEAGNYYGNYVPNWLRDENERVLLMGALAEVFFFLQENEEAQKYSALFAAEIQELNNEDQMRNASGGNVQVNFNGRGLI